MICQVLRSSEGKSWEVDKARAISHGDGNKGEGRCMICPVRRTNHMHTIPSTHHNRPHTHASTMFKETGYLLVCMMELYQARARQPRCYAMLSKCL